MASAEGQSPLFIRRGYTRQLYLGKNEVSLGKVAFFRVTDFTSGKITHVNFRDEVIENIKMPQVRPLVV